MDTDYLLDLPAFAYEPHKPPRTDIAGDMVFYKAWQVLTRSPETLSSIEDFENAQFAHIVRAHGFRLNQRCATVATTFMTWLGSNNGRHYLTRGAQLMNLPQVRYPYLLAWSDENMRVIGTNRNQRMIELMLDGSTVTEEDYELVEHLTVWLGEAEGQAFLAACEAQLNQQRKNEQLETYLSTNTALSEGQVSAILRMAAEYSPNPVNAL